MYAVNEAPCYHEAYEVLIGGKGRDYRLELATF